METRTLRRLNFPRFAGAVLCGTVLLGTLGLTTAQEQKLKLVLLANPKDTNELKAVQVRPGVDEDQAFYLCVKNPSADDKEVIVTFQVGDDNREVPFKVPAGRTVPVPFGKPAADPKTGKDPTPIWHDVKGQFQATLQEKVSDSKPVVFSASVELLAPAQCVEVSASEFWQDENRQANQLTVKVKARMEFTGPPCAVALELPEKRNPGLEDPKPEGTFGEKLKKAGEEKVLLMQNIRFKDGARGKGYLYVNVDGHARAFVYEIDLDQTGTQTLTPLGGNYAYVRLVNAERYVREGAKYPITLEVDNAPSDVTLKVGLDRNKDDKFEGDEVVTLIGPRKQEVQMRAEGAGALLFKASVSDWREDLNIANIRGERNIRVWLLQKDTETEFLGPDNERVDFLQTKVTVDSSPPEKVQFVELPPQKPLDGTPLKAQANGVDPESTIAAVRFFWGKPEVDKDGKKKPPANATFYPGKPDPKDSTKPWAAEVPLPLDKKGPVELTVEFTNGAQMTAFATTVVNLVEPAAGGGAAGSIRVSVYDAGDRKQTQLKDGVVLRDEKGMAKDVKPKIDKGDYLFEDVPPGKYTVYAVKPANNPKNTSVGRASVTVEANKEATAKIELKVQ